MFNEKNFSNFQQENKEPNKEKERVDEEILTIINGIEKQGLNPRDVLYHLIKNLRENGQDRLLTAAVEKTMNDKDDREKMMTEKEIWRNKLDRQV